MITLWIQFDGLAYPIPVNPKELTISQSATNTNIDIIGLGKATRKGNPGLRTLKIDSFFPSPKSRYYQNIPAATYIQFINKIWNTENVNNKVGWIYSMGGINDVMLSEPINMYFVIEKFDYKFKGGDYDTEYSLSLKEYKEYGVKVTTENFTEGQKSARIPSTVKANIPELMQDTNPTTSSKTFKVPNNYSLWRIAKESTGNGNNWQALYELNKNIIGDDPNKLPVGITLTLPENWNSPKATTNTSTSTKVSNAGSNNKKQTTLNNATASNEVEPTKQVVSFDADKEMEKAYENQFIDAMNEFTKLYDKNKQVAEQLITRQEVFSASSPFSSAYDYFKSSVNVLTGNAYLEKAQQDYSKFSSILNDDNMSNQDKAIATKEIIKSEQALADRIAKETSVST